jgi:hypothetical protein
MRGRAWHCKIKRKSWIQQKVVQVEARSTWFLSDCHLEHVSLSFLLVAANQVIHC